MKIRSDTRSSDFVFRHQWILEAAYYRAENRDFAPGMELDDWLLAEKGFVTMLIMRYLDVSHEDGGITVKGLQRLAKSVGVEYPEGITLAVDLIHAIQKATDNDPCFNFEPGTPCNTVEYCLWRSECKKMVAKWRP